MLNKIIRFSLDNRFSVILGFLLLLIAGIYTARNMEVDVFPDLNAPTVVVMTEAAGFAPEEVERLITFPVETAVNGASGVRRVRSTSTTGFSIVWVEFDWGEDIYRARQIVSEKLSAVAGELPQAAGVPTMGPQTSILGEIMIISLTSDTIPLDELRATADFTLRPRLMSIGGVAQVSVIGGGIKEYQILLHPWKLKYYGITLAEVLDKVQGINDNANGGILYQYGNEYIIRGAITTLSPDDLAATVVKRTSDGHIHLSDISEVRVGEKSPKLGVASTCGKQAVLLTVIKQPEAGTIELTDKIDRTLEAMQDNLPAGIEMRTDIFRQSDFIDNSIDNIKKSLYEGAFFVIVILLLFLMNIRITAISLVTIPLSLIITILVLKLMGLTINTMSIGGMAIAIGSLVDDAIVDVENVYKHLRKNAVLPEGRKMPYMQVIYEASKEVRLPILNSTFIIVVSFLPLFFLSGIEGRMLVPLGTSFIVSLFASTIIALTLTPVLSSYLLKREGSVADINEPPFSRHLAALYKTSLTWALNHAKSIIMAAVLLFVVSLVTIFTMGRNFLPSFNEGSFTINISALPGLSLEESDKIGRLAEEILMTVPEINSVARKTGRAELDEHALGVNTSEIEAPFTLDGRSKDQVIKEVRQKLSVIPGVNIEIGQPISHRIDAMLSGTQSNIAIKVFGSNLNKMHEIGQKIKREISGIPGVVDVNVEQQIERPQLKITPKREMMARYGITPRMLSDDITVLLAGVAVSQVYDGNNTYDVTLKLDDASRNSMDAIRNMMIDTSDGKIPLYEVADITSASGPNTINRENAERKIVVSANIAEGGVSSGVDRIKEKIESSVLLPEGYHIEYGGQFESEAEASRRLSIMSLISMLVIFMLLYKQFGTLRQAGIVMINLPLALIGGVLTLKLFDGIISIPAIIGFISLFGIATRNGILLVDRYNHLQAEGGRTLRQTVMQGSADRLNPIMMTALTSALALIPLAVAGDLPGNEIQSPMAKVILGGLLTSTLLNIYIIPAVYILTEKKNRKTTEKTI